MVKIIKVKAIVSILLFITFLVTLFSGIGLMISPRGKVANMTNWIFLGLDKWQLLKVHTLFGFAMAILVIVHLFLNYKLFFSELKFFKKKV